jgi:pimeloyl-ACP methyl ester carboxylesterase
VLREDSCVPETSFEEDAMKIIQWLTTVVLLIAGVVLVRPVFSQAAKFVPTRFTVTDAGTAGKPDMVLIPGLTSSAHVWDAEASKLGPNYRLHVVQVDGFAGAPAGANKADGQMLPGIVEELHQYIASRQMTPVVMGHSLGGLVTLMLAAKYPTDVQKMIIVDSLPFYGLVFDPNATVENIKPKADMMKQMLSAQDEEKRAAGSKMTASFLCKNPDGATKVQADSMASDKAVFVEAMYEDMMTDVGPEMAQVKTPMLLLYPYDASVAPDAAKYDAIYHGAYASKPNATLLRIDDSRHFIMYDQPEKMDAAIEGWLK